MTRGPTRIKPPHHSWAALVADFRQTPQYRGWGRAYARFADKIMDDFVRENGDLPVKGLRRSDVLRMRGEMADTPSAANNWMKIFRALLDCAVDLDYAPTNVARTKIKGLKSPNPDGFRTWREDEIAAYLLHYEMGELPHTAFILALYTGAEVSALVQMGPGSVEWNGPSVECGHIRYRRKKTGRWVTIPILPPLAEVLAILPPKATFLETRDGLPRSSKSLTGDMRKWAKAAGLGEPDAHGRYLSFHGLRKAFGRRLAEAGASVYGIMGAMGHENVRSTEPYTKEFNRTQAADDALGKLGSAEAPNVVRIVRKPNA